MNRKLYMDEKTRVRNAGFATLKGNLDTLLKEVAAYANARCAEVAGEHHHHHHGHDHHDHDHDHDHPHDQGHHGHDHKH